ncbi:MAG: hypothetical protein QOF20_2817 [Acidimicrobiaceae bacterium]|jgi:uncharacterized protein YukJ|nr:hypothetical protein [Acidimicrobiaceae bacterium]
MPIKNYGVLRGTAVAGRLDGPRGQKPHYQIHLTAHGIQYRVAVNVVSDQAPSELLFLLDPDFRHPVIAKVAAVADGFTALPPDPGGAALDFIRGGLFRPEDMKAVPVEAPGADNDLTEIFVLHVDEAIIRGADVFAFGSRWGPEPGKPDDFFQFAPGNGIHDIHMNQGSPPPHDHDNGIWQDGCLFIHFPAGNGDERWLAFFLVFQSQFAQTDDRGDPIPGAPKFGPTAPSRGGGDGLASR